jgi:hypothetical protein
MSSKREKERERELYHEKETRTIEKEEARF